MLLGICLIILINILCFTSALAENISVETWIKKQKIIRIYIEDTGLGLGNETRSYNLIRRFWQLGFEGTFYVISSYDNSEKQPSVAKLFNLPANFSQNLGDPYTYEYDDLGKKRKLIFIRLKNYYDLYQAGKIDLVDLAVSAFGKDSPPCGRLYWEKKDNAELTDDIDNSENPFCNNLANFANAKIFLNFSGKISDQNNIAGSIIKINEQNNTIVTTNGKNFFIAPNFTLDQAENYLLTDPNGQALSKQKPALKSLIEGIKSDQLPFNILPVYGWTIGTYFEEERHNFPANILQIITGARYAQLNKGSNALLDPVKNTQLQKPLIILVFYDYDNQAKQLDDIINKDNWTSFDLIKNSIISNKQWFSVLHSWSFLDATKKNGLEETRIANEIEIAKQNIRDALASLDLPGNFIVANIQDPQTPEIIKNLTPGKIYLLTMGPLPKIVFDGIYDHTGGNVWPQIREGESSLDSLVITGKPHIRCEGRDANVWEPGFNNMSPPLKNALEKFYGIMLPGNSDPSNWNNTTSCFCEGMKTWFQYKTVYQDLGSFFIDASNPNSLFSNYFKELKYDALNYKNDSIYTLLQEGIASYSNDRNADH